ncbi:MAG: NAD(P)H-hydrate epimerase [Deltaproteobacteria bacterium]
MNITARQARAIDRRARERFGLSTLVLMENAGAAAADEALDLCPRGRVAVVCGKGNNGGDGFVATRHLLARGARVEVFLASPAAQVRGEAAVNLSVLRKLGCPLKELSSSSIPGLRRSLKASSLVIDALLGTGIRGEVEGLYASVIGSVNASGARVLAVDIPSGLDADTGKILGRCVAACRTVTFFARKKGMTTGEGPRLCGEVKVKALGLPLRNVLTNPPR